MSDDGYPVAAQQKCLAHLRRHFQRLIKLSGQNNQAIGKVFIDLIDEAFRSYQLLGKSQDEARYRDWAVQFKALVELTIKQWLTKAGYVRALEERQSLARRRLAGKLLRNLKLKAEQWWYFLDHPEVPPDNNLALAIAAVSSN